MRREAQMRIYVTSLGCKLNQAEMDALAARLAPGGHEVVRSAAEADLCILNTCAVTHVAAQKSRQALRRLHRENPAARLIATGCYAELAPAELQPLPGVERVVGNQEKDRLAELIEAPVRAPLDSVSRPSAEASGSARPWSRTRALVKIQDGCDNACTYCIIHVARGPQRSRPVDQVLSEVQARLEAGHKEVVLTGVHIGAYGRDGRDRMPGGHADLWVLVERILAETDVIRLRLSSIEPWDLPAHAFRLWEDRRLCRHLHLPLQSGADAVLHRMNRRYTAPKFARLVQAAREAIPDLAVTTDVIVGFPGETAGEFAESLAFVESMGFARVHVFPYSLREHTSAAGMADQVPPPVKAERARAMRAVAEESARAFRQRFVGREMAVLWETSRHGEAGPTWSGLTDNYLRVRTVSTADLTNRVMRTRLIQLAPGGLHGRIDLP
jgi:threonylcarbamoyladenosine tRNA methylthiotransferase MtaB